MGETVSKTMVWAHFPSIFLEMLDKEILSSIGEIIEKTIRVDGLWLTSAHDKFARVYVPNLSHH